MNDRHDDLPVSADSEPNRAAKERQPVSPADPQPSQEPASPSSSSSMTENSSAKMESDSSAQAADPAADSSSATKMAPSGESSRGRTPKTRRAPRQPAGTSGRRGKAKEAGSPSEEAPQTEKSNGVAESVDSSQSPAPQAEAGDHGSSRSSKENSREGKRSADGQSSTRDDRDESRDSGAPSDRGGPDRGDQHQDHGGGGKKGRRNRQRNRQRRKEKEVPAGPPVETEGLLEISGKGFAFLRQRERNFQQSPSDVFVTPEIVRNFGLRDGVWVRCLAREGNRGPQLTEILDINGREPDAYRTLPYFEELTAINPNKRIKLETIPERYTTRVIDLMTPVGRGQRGLIVAPPRTGKTTLLQHMAQAILENYDDTMKLMIVLVDERPEEVTDFQREIPEAEIMASSNDSDVRNHIRIAELAIERAKRLVEAGEHVFLLLDSITRLARAYNNATKGKGRTMSGGIDVKALEMPRKLFAAARNTREAGSLTILATALIQTNSKADELIFQEFKGTGNMELVLDRAISQQYIYPAVDIHKSGTRREELLIPGHQLEKVYIIRRGLAGHKPIEAMERLLTFLERFSTNAQLLMEIKATAAA